MALRVYDLEFDDHNADEAAAHGVTEREIFQVLDNAPVFLPNKKAGSCPVVMIGPTFGGRFLTVPISPTAVDGTWRPGTAFESSAGERARYHAACRR